ncbi:MAG: Glyoxalase/bleomycin resistance protein/dioxygenase [Verrucomicrobiales bacterium]|nr:Glyoxalase/bleomycin resistance protein/dioxygenase [Verrucomicrobiales bacterium]
MTPAALNLVVLRCSDMARAADFYSRLGLQFVQHRHGNGLEHFSADAGECVFELYPRTAGGPSTEGARIGFRVASLEAAAAAFHDFPDAILSPPADSPWGRRAVIADPDGHRVELIQQHLPPLSSADPISETRIH